MLLIVLCVELRGQRLLLIVLCVELRGQRLLLIVLCVYRTARTAFPIDTELRGQRFAIDCVVCRTARTALFAIDCVVCSTARTAFAIDCVVCIQNCEDSVCY